jgi:spore germination protein
MKNVLIFLILISISIGSSLKITPRIIDKIHIITVAGYEQIKGDKFRGTIVIPVFKPDKTVKNVTFTSTGSIISENRLKVNAESSRPLETGKLQVALFNIDLAKRGILKYLDNLERDPTVGSRVNLAIVDGSTHDMLTKDYEGISTGRYLSQLIEHNMNIGSLPRTNLHVFSQRFFAEGIDPILPLLKQKGNKVEIEGIALFNKDKYVEKLSYNKGIIFIMILEDFKRAEFTIKHKGEKPIASLQIVDSNRKVKINQHSSTPIVTIYVKMRGHIREYSGNAVNNKIIISLQKEAEKQTESMGEKMLARFQKLNIDPIGVGRAVKAHSRDWNEKKWKDQYQNVKINVKADITITETGVIE